MSLLETLFSQDAIERLGWMLVHFLWQATAVALLLMALLRLLRHAGANLRYAVACGALVLMVVLPLITMQIVEVPGPAAEAGPPSDIAPPAPAESLPVTVQRVGELPPLSSASLETADLAAPISWQERTVAALEPALPYLVLGWLAGVFGLSAWHLGGWTQLHRLKCRLTRRADAALHAVLDELATRLDVRRAVTLLESAVVDVPTVVGWLRPVILLPASALTGLSPDQLRAILAHELAHVRRYDYLANILQTVVEILGFYHPAVWWVSARIRIERENCCDDLAVRICGNSLQYARALTSMEEIRHNRSNLALAASGGSLMARVARLLGRPAVDDRRFTWLPGLIALLLVVGIVIPTALALTHPAPQLPEPPVDDASALMDATQDAADPDESPQAHIAIRFVQAGVFTDAVLDPQTAAKTADLLVRIPADNGGRHAAGAIPPPTVEELQQPLAKVFSTFAPAPGRGNELVDLLGIKGYAAWKLASPKTTVLAGETASFTVGDTGASDTAEPVNSDLNSVRYDVTATEIQDQNAVRVDVDMVLTFPAHKPGNSNEETTKWILRSTVLAPDDQWTPIPHTPLKRVDENGREYLHLLLVHATVVDEPESRAIGAGVRGAMPPMNPAGPRVDLGPGMGAMPPLPSAAVPRTIVESPSQSDAQQAQVLIDFVVAKALTEAALDRETMLQIGPVLATERPQFAARIAADPAMKMTLGEMLKEYVTRRPLSQETGKALLALLQTRGFVGVLSRPQVITSDGDPAQVRVMSEEWFARPSQGNDTAAGEALEKVEYGTALKVTPHMEADKNITLEVAVTLSEPAPQAQPNGLPIVRTIGTATAISVPDNRYFSLLVESSDHENRRAQDTESLLVLFRPTVVHPVPPPVEPPESQTRQDDKRPQQVLLDARVVVMERGNLLNLGVEWQFPTMQYGRFPDAGSVGGLTLGYAPDSTFTASLMAKLNGLAAAGKAEIMANPQIVALEGRQAQLRSIEEEWFLMSDSGSSKLQKTQAGTILTMTPRVGDRNEITLETAIELSNSLPRGAAGSDLPIITRRQTKNKITLLNGGTMAIAGLIENPPGQNGQSAMEVILLVTAHLVPESD